ncbi:Basic leucine zipper and W2 domain-containing protein 1 [Smittium mucronatum]|uniref:Basic leucine zipper and W2 domain-containing protein 1 n=1 Tax=Smittium mucronatum TaxID=133383 RepID=A0A1R0GXK3_9FUNG|nr:Basic leucine zipper and W2 domain-containing protein 1 [Smittium mucronatum]
MSTQQNLPKPSLNGVKIKTRKRVNKANAKFEPEAFRDSIFEVISEVTDNDLEKISSKLDSAGGTLDYRLYGETFFELLVAGGLIAPGGVIEYDDEYGELQFSLFKLSDSEDPLPGAKIWVNLILRLTRRYKYLEKIFSETSKGILEYINRYPEGDNNKLAAGYGLLIAEGLISADCIKILQKDHLVKDGYALQFLTMFMKAYLTRLNVKSLFNALYKARADHLIEFFPPNKRTDEYFTRHFESEDMHSIINYRIAEQANAARDVILYEIVQLINSNEEDDPPLSEIIKVGRRAMSQNNLSENEVVVLIWDAIIGNIKWGMRSEVIEQQALSEVKEYADVFTPFTSSPKSEMALLKHIQKYCYEDAKLMRLFSQIVRILYNEDVLSHDAIIFWANKGALPQGKSTFIKQMDKFVAFLNSIEDEEESDESDDE